MKTKLFEIIETEVPKGEHGTTMEADSRKGKIAERIFKEDFLIPTCIDYKDVTDDNSFRKKGIDFITEKMSFDIKGNYKDNNEIQIEEESSDGIVSGYKKKGWWYTSEAKVFVFVSLKTRTMIFLENNEEAHKRYKDVKYDYVWKINDNSFGKDLGKWRSSFRNIPLSVFDGLYTIHKFERK